MLGVETQQLKFVSDPLYGDHLRGIGHPESPDRVEVVASRLRERGTIRETIAPRDATDEEIARAHDPGYIELVKREVSSLCRGAAYLSTGDVVVDERSLAVARRAAGGAIAAMEATTASGEPVFALIRPPGHHAEPERGMGFCLFNNAVAAARAYQVAHGGRVLVVDFDYHHGNGTEASAGSGLSYVSTHAFPAYPGTGRSSYRTGDDLVVNVPLPASGVSTEGFIALWEALLPRVAAAVKPDFLAISAGFDYVAGDPIGDLGVGVEAARALAATIERVALERCGGRAAYLLEGGYSIDALTESIAGIAEAVDARTTAPSGAAPLPLPAQLERLLADF